MLVVKGKSRALSSLLVVMVIVAVFVIFIWIGAVFSWFSSDTLKTKELDFTDFTTIEVTDSFEVVIKQSSFYSVKLITDDKIIGNMEINQTDRILTIGVEYGVYPGDLFRKVEISMPELDKVVLLDASCGTAECFSSSNMFVIELSGASSFQMSNMSLGDIVIELSGASTLIAQGEANNLVSIVSGASNMDLNDLIVDNADVELGGASQAIVNLQGRLNANVSGSSTLQYFGEVTMGEIDISDDSSLEKK